MATLTKNAAGNWKAIIRKTGWPTTIKTFRTRRDADDWARRTEDEMVRGIYIDRGPSERLIFDAAMARYLSEVSPTKNPGTHAREGGFSKPLLKALGKYSLGAITADLVARYRDDRLAEGKSNNTVRLELALLSHLYTTAIREWRLGLVYNPVAAMRKPAAGQGRTRRLSLAEEQLLVSACAAHSNPLLVWMVRLALYTGMRAGEIQSLRCGQVDLSRRVIRLDMTKNGSARTVPLTRNAVEVIQAALAHSLRPKETDLIFWGDPGRDGKIRPYQFRPAWRQVLQRAGLEGFHFHDLRHEAISRFVEAGLGDQDVAAISGHKSMQMLKRYTHLRAEDLVVKLDKAIQ